MATVLDDEAIEAGLPRGWKRDGAEIVRRYTFEDYLVGVSFAVEVAEVAEEEFHHPSIIIDHGEVEVRFTSHEQGGITDQDLEMAELTNELR